MKAHCPGTREDAGTPELQTGVGQPATDGSLRGLHVVLTGGAGFLGTSLAVRLAVDNRVTLFDNLRRNALDASPVRGDPRVRLVKGDVRDRTSLRSVMTADVEVVVHCASVAGVASVRTAALETIEVCVEGLLNTLRVASQLPRLRRFVLLSTSEVLGRMACDVGEETAAVPLNVNEPRWSYAAAKLAAEYAVMASHRERGLPTVIIRPFNIYGPNQVGEGAVHAFIRRALAGEDLIVHDDGQQVRSWCYVDDFVNGLTAACERAAAVGKVYNLGNPRSTVTTLQLARLVLGAANSESRIRFAPIDYANVAVRIPSIRAARQDLAFEPEVDLEEGLARTVEWYRSRA